MQSTLFNIKPDSESMENDKSQTLISRNSISNNEIKSKPRENIEKNVLHMGKIDPNIMNESPAINSLMVKITTNTTSMNKMQLIKC